MLVTLALLAATAPSMDQASLIESLKAHRLELVSTKAGSYSGAGWERLLQEGRDAQFFMVGEQHATADIAAFEVALHRRLMDVGFTHLGLEIGPYSARFAEKLSRSREGALAAYIRQPGHGFTLPFLFFADELAFVENTVARFPKSTDRIWGVDQEFVGSAPILIEWLRPHAQTPLERAALDKLEAQSVKDPLLIGKLLPGDVDALAAAFRSADQQARDLIEAIRVTSDIYGPFTRRSGPIYFANLARETYMKRNFLSAFNAAAKVTAPKVFLKFGGNHAMRGMT